MATKIKSGAVRGLDGILLEVEADISPALPNTVIVGLPDTAVREAKERVKSAIRNSGWLFPLGRIAVNLAPAELPKSGSMYDLPIALAILAEAGALPNSATLLANSLFVGELGLNGGLRPVEGALPLAITCREKGIRRLVLPKESASEAGLVGGVEIIPASSLAEVGSWLKRQHKLEALKPAKNGQKASIGIDFADIAGQTAAKRIMLIAAAGGHNVLLSGPPGTGKTMLAKAMQGILPPLSDQEALEIAKIYSVAGLLSGQAGALGRPFRAPHHSSSTISLIGGGSRPKPGEISLAHKGVLYLDEFGEFARSSLESLRQPLEEGRIKIDRTFGKLTFPAEFTLVATQNPCPCGYLGSTLKECSCTDGAIYRYKNKVSGPILDRIDLFGQTEAVEYEELKDKSGPDSASLRQLVVNCRQTQINRSGKLNARLKPSEVRKYCLTKAKSDRLLAQAVAKLGLSARAVHRLLKVSRTIADLDEAPDIEEKHLAEALQYRSKS